MGNILKGNYEMKKPIIGKEEHENSDDDDFKKKALNSIGGSMVFVERKKLLWEGNDEEVTDKED
ncbi:MAG: hypothetical protein HOK72_09990 [Flavobacteriales bacterium]|jgi:hypothetical protein|nr:hypothetical protein [Flavobacteriales bacterium]